MTSPSTIATPYPAWRFIPAAEAVVLARWDADFHVGIQRTGGSWHPLSALDIEIHEGLRPGRGSGPNPLVYRPSNLDRGLLRPDVRHLVEPPRRTTRALGPGDVVVSKFLPPRVALVTSQAPRHVPDGNCLRVLGLEPADALWLVALLAHPSFAKLVAQRGAGRTLPRIGARELAELPVPPTPPGLGPLAEAWTDAADQHLALHRGLMELRAEVQSIADDAAPPPPDPRHPSWVRAWEMPDTWAPDQAALLAYQRRLGRSGWVPLEPFLAPEPARLRARIPPARVLRLGHASGDLGYRLPELEPVRPPWFRLYADPMRPAEVLLSTLGSAPKVVVNLPTADSTVWLSDQWARLDGGSTPGALALLLGVSQVAWQLERAATGAVRQFIGRVELAKIRIPSLSRGEARALHDRLVSLLERRTRVDQQLGGLRAELAGLVDAAMRGAA